MNIDSSIGTIVIIVLSVLLLARILILQRIKSKRAEMLLGKSKRAIKKAIEKGKLDSSAADHHLHLVSGYLILISILIILFGVVLHFTDWPVKGWIVQDWWWVIICAGVAILGLSID